MQYEHKIVDPGTGASNKKAYLEEINRHGQDGWEYSGETAAELVVMRRCVGLSPTVDAALKMLETDPHQWSTRPCATCMAMSTAIGRAFGCVAEKTRGL